MKLSTICGFKRVQSLTTDEQVVRDALVNSTQVEVSEDGTQSIVIHALSYPNSTQKSTSGMGSSGIRQNCFVIQVL